MSRITKDRLQRLQEITHEQRVHQTQQLQEQQVQQQNLTSRSSFKRFQAMLFERIKRVRSPDTFAREGVKAIIYFGLPVVFTFILTQPQFAEKIILNFVRSTVYLIQRLR